MIELICCRGGCRAIAPLVLAAGWRYGARLPSPVYAPLYFADQDWKKPQGARYLSELARHRPSVATVLDIDRPSQLPAVLSLAEEAAEYVQTVVLIPKISGIIPSLPKRIGTARVVLGYSVPTKYGGTLVPLPEFKHRPVHLLGGSPQKQMQIAEDLDVVSVDGNMMGLHANRCRTWQRQKVKRSPWVQLRDLDPYWQGSGAYLECFRRSLYEIREAWRERGFL